MYIMPLSFPSQTFCVQRTHQLAVIVLRLCKAARKQRESDALYLCLFPLPLAHRLADVKLGCQQKGRKQDRTTCCPAEEGDHILHNTAAGQQDEVQDGECRCMSRTKMQTINRTRHCTSVCRMPQQSRR